MLRKMCFALFGLVFLSGQECPSDPITTTTDTPVVNPVLPAPLPLANVSTWHFFSLTPDETADISIYSQTNALPYQLVNGQFIEVGIDHARGKASSAWLKFATYSLPADLEGALLALYATGDSLTRPVSIFVDAPIGQWSEASTVQSLPQVLTGNVATKAPVPGGWFILEADLGPLIRGWIKGDFPNNGIQLRPDVSAGPGLMWNTFCSTDYYDPKYRPTLCVKFIDSGPPRFKFPLDGKYGPERLGGYFHFGSRWSKAGIPQYCTQGGMENVPLLHTGIDLYAKPNDLEYAGDPVYAVERGVVKYSNTFGAGFADVVVIEHEDIERNEVFETVYGHINSEPSIVPGAIVTKGGLLGTVANIGDNSHLHFGVRHGAFIPELSIIGRLPEKSCTTEHSPTLPEPKFPDDFSDPQQMLWEE